MAGPDRSASQAEDRSVKDALRAIMEARPGQWTIEELDAQIVERGSSDLWGPFGRRQAIELAVARLLAAGEAERVRPGVVRYDAFRSRLAS
jgi:hypothetical protein